MKLFKKGATKEWDFTRDLILAFHERKSVERTVKLNDELQKYNNKREVDLVIATLRYAIDYNRGAGQDRRFEKNWFVRLDQNVVKKNRKYGCDWVYVSACILAVVGAPEVAREIRVARPEQSILFVSGYSETDAIRAAAPGAALLSKPFRSEGLAAAVRKVLSGT